MSQTDLLKKKKILKTQITKFKEKIKWESLNSIACQLFIENYESFKIDLKKIFDELYNVCDEKDIDKFVEEQLNIQESIDDVILELKGKSEKLNSHSKPEVNSQVTSLQGIKLPKLTLPTFSGNLHDWITFNDLFKASVHNNPNLSNGQKLQYLKSSLKGDAYRIIQSIAISDNNYNTAWELLEDRYSNNREQIFAYIRRLMSLNKIQIESASAILNLVDNVNEIIRALEILEQKVENFSDTLLLYVILEKLDSSTKLWWERQIKKDEIPKLYDLIEFLKHYARTLQNSKIPLSKDKPFHNKVNTFVTNLKCICCHEDHQLFKCSTFLQLAVQKRIEFVKSNRLCFNCLSNMHQVKQCKSVYKCKHCAKAHHTMLHIENAFKPKLDSNARSPHARAVTPKGQEVIDVRGNSEGSTSSAVCASSACNNKHSHILLCTAVVRIRNSNEEWVKCRCLLDTGSQRSFISKECVERLDLSVRDSAVSISCLGSFNTVTNGEVDLFFTSHFDSDLRIATSAFVIEKVTDKIPYVSLPSSISNNFHDLQLADPSFHKSKNIDILLGVNVFLNLINGNIIKRAPNLPFALSSKLGWIISGTTDFESQNFNPVSVNYLSVNTKKLDKHWYSKEKKPGFTDMPISDQRNLTDAETVDVSDEEKVEEVAETSNIELETGSSDIALFVVKEIKEDEIRKLEETEAVEVNSLSEEKEIKISEEREVVLANELKKNVLH